MRFYYPDVPSLPLTAGHRFPAGKYAMLLAAVRERRVLGSSALIPSPAIGLGDLRRAHDDGYIESILQGSAADDVMRRIGLPWSPALVTRTLAAVGGSLAAARAALETGLSGQLAGGTHHAHAAFGSGFCVFNDLAVAALTLLAERQVGRVAIVDLDVHQGDGNAAILGGNRNIFILSVQGAKNFPFRRVPATLDIDLPDSTGDEAYLAALAPALEQLAAFRPELVLYLSGADPLAEDTLGRLSLTHEGLARRDRMVFQWCRSRAVPVSIAIGGGYAKPIENSVEAYVATFRVALETLAPHMLGRQARAHQHDGTAEYP